MLRDMKRSALVLLALVACGHPVVATTQVSAASDGDQRFAELGTCKLDGGAVIEGCRIGYRTYGKLDASRSNLVLWPTWFTGDTKPLTDAVPDKIVDTKKFFLVLVDALGDGVSSSPSNSAKQPRLKFPVFTIHDMVESERRLVREVFGVTKMRAVMGISMGGMQTFEWAVSHPDEMDRIVPIVGSPQLGAQDLLLWKAELDTLEGSIAYNHGAYEGHPKLPALQELHWAQLTTPAFRTAETSRAAFPAWVASIANDTSFDWNDWHRQLEAMLGHDVARADGGDLVKAAARVKAKALVIVAEQDHMVNPGPAKAFAAAMHAEVYVSPAPCGHMAPGCDDDLAKKAKAFLEER